MIVQWDAADAATAAQLRSMDEDDLVDWLESPEGRISFDVDKAWHAVHFHPRGRRVDPGRPARERGAGR